MNGKISLKGATENQWWRKVQNCLEIVKGAKIKVVIGWRSVKKLFIFNWKWLQTLKLITANIPSLLWFFINTLMFKNEWMSSQSSTLTESPSRMLIPIALFLHSVQSFKHFSVPQLPCASYHTLLYTWFLGFNIKFILVSCWCKGLVECLLNDGNPLDMNEMFTCILKTASTVCLVPVWTPLVPDLLNPEHGPLLHLYFSLMLGYCMIFLKR